MHLEAYHIAFHKSPALLVYPAHHIAQGPISVDGAFHTKFRHLFPGKGRVCERSPDLLSLGIYIDRFIYIKVRQDIIA
jgi:hypothetical protein